MLGTFILQPPAAGRWIRPVLPQYVPHWTLVNCSSRGPITCWPYYVSRNESYIRERKTQESCVFPLMVPPDPDSNYGVFLSDHHIQSTSGSCHTAGKEEGWELKLFLTWGRALPSLRILSMRRCYVIINTWLGTTWLRGRLGPGGPGSRL